MSDPAGDLQAPVLLLAMPQVLDPYFHRSVVLLARHEAEGSGGFIINKPTEIRLAEILDGMEIPWAGNQESLAHFGGPVQPQVGSVLYSTRGKRGASLPEDGGAVEVLPGVAVTQHIGDLQHLAADPPKDIRLYLGYSGWGEGQLLEEILRNDWLTAPARRELIFAARPETVWDRAMRSVGVDPTSLPSWTSVDGGSEAN